jgi:hypothetical protein
MLKREAWVFGPGTGAWGFASLLKSTDAQLKTLGTEKTGTLSAYFKRVIGYGS